MPRGLTKKLSITRIKIFIIPTHRISPLAFPGGSEVKASAYSVGDLGSIPGSGRSPGERNGNPLQYFCLENPMDGGAWWATVHGVTKSRTRLSNLTNLTFQGTIRFPILPFSKWECLILLLFYLCLWYVLPCLLFVTVYWMCISGEGGGVSRWQLN